MFDPTTIGLLGLIVTGLSATTLRILSTNFGEQQLNRLIDWMGHNWYTNDPNEPEQRVIEGLKILHSEYKEGTIEQNYEGFEGVLEAIQNASQHPDNFEDLEYDDVVVGLKREQYDVEELQQRDIIVGPQYHITAKIDDGSDKIVSRTGKIRGIYLSRKANEKKEGGQKDGNLKIVLRTLSKEVSLQSEFLGLY